MAEQAPAPPREGVIGAFADVRGFSARALELLGSWPRSHSNVVRMAWESPTPMFVAWGEELNVLYNAPCAALLGPSHPDSFMAPLAHVLATFAIDAHPLTPNKLASGGAVFENVRLRIAEPAAGGASWFTFSLSPLGADGDCARGLFAVGIDMTNAILSRERVISEKNLIRDLFQQAPGFMAMALGERHVIEFANDAWFSLIGDRAVIGKPIREALPELEGQGIFELADEAYASGKPFVGREVPVVLARQGPADLETRYVDMVFQPIKRDGVVFGILTEGYDVSEQKKAKEELLVLQSELIHVSRVGAMSAMAATLAHELNQPLTAIKAYVGGARRHLEQGAAGLGEARMALVDASAATTRAGEIIKRLRNMVSRGEPEVELADLGPIVRDAVALASLGLAEEGVLTSIDIADEVPVKVDKVQIQQVVVNLFRNAVAATEACKRREIAVRLFRRRGFAVLEVDDSGPGIDPDTAGKIFTPLFTTKARGLGVGLAISRTIVEAHRGKIWSSASPLGGARLNVRLPLAWGKKARIES